MEQAFIEIVKARSNNLKEITLSIPKHKLVVFTGVSGSGKSSLLFDTIYTEAQRQLIETFSTFARARMPRLSRPDVEDIRNLSTSIVIDQKRMGSNIRSTVGTATEINTYLRLLYSRFGEPFIGPSFLFSFNHPEGMCPACHGLGKRVRIHLGMLLDREKSLREGAIVHPECKVGGWFWREILSIGLFDPDKKLKDYSQEELDKLLYTKPVLVTKSHGAGTYSKNYEGIARRLERAVTGKAEDEAPDEKKDVYQRYFIYSDCDRCGGTRLNERARGATINGMSLPELCDLELFDAHEFLESIGDARTLPVKRKAEFLLRQLIDIGVGYLTLSRTVSTLSGGESQRVKMARQMDCNLTELMYILDEPTIGLHPSDTEKMLGMLHRLKNRGNSVFIIEHDREIILAAEWIVDMGPAAGEHGGHVVFTGAPEKFRDSGCITARLLYQGPAFPGADLPAQGTESTAPDRAGLPAADRAGLPARGVNGAQFTFLTVENARVHNLKNISVKIPSGKLTCVTGVAGSGKSSLINHCFLDKYPGAIHVDQSPIGRSSRANPSTYTGMFDLIRKEFATATGENISLFSFNSKGACPKCKGQGFLALEMHFLDAVRTVCDECNGTRFNSDIIQLKYRGRSIAEVLDFTVDEAMSFFDHSEIRKRLRVLSDVGLGYLRIGQSLSTLSGGEAQRLKLASELHKQGNIYILDEPTTGLHLSDTGKLIEMIRKLTGNGNTVVVIEHNTDIISQADWVIDLGPGGGKNGGELLYQGPVSGLPGETRSLTGQYLGKTFTSVVR